MDVGSAIVVGLIATLVMMLLVYLAKAIGMMPAIHPRIGGKVLPESDFFAKNMSSMAPVGIIMLHIIFGIVLGVIYTPAAT